VRKSQYPKTPTLCDNVLRFPVWYPHPGRAARQAVLIDLREFVRIHALVKEAAADRAPDLPEAGYETQHPFIPTGLLLQSL
jgi:hypothetical protein